MPRRAVTNVTDIPVDILCRLITDPDSYGELIDGWRNAKGEAIRDRQRADEAARIADQKEAAVAARLVAAEKHEVELAEKDKRKTGYARIAVSGEIAAGIRKLKKP